MSQISISVKKANGDVMISKTSSNLVNMMYNYEYQPGDSIHLECSEYNVYMYIRLDDAMAASFILLTEPFTFPIPLGEKHSVYSPKTFIGSLHILSARLATAEEISAYKNLACNVYDHQGNKSCFPHASANVETRDEAAFAARNAIDGFTTNDGHGEWPFGSWGINRRDDAEITIEFGRTVDVDKIVIFLRADFPHDNYWKTVDFVCSDGSTLTVHLEKTEAGQTIMLNEAKKVGWIKMCNLIMSDESSPFPALTQLEIYGCDNR